VLAGVCGEVDWIATRIGFRTEPSRKRIKPFAEASLVLGLCVELICIPFSFHDIAALEAKSSEAQLEAARARLELEQIKERERYRVLSPSQSKQIASELKGKINLPIWFEIDTTSDDASGYADSLSDALSKAGCTILPQRGALTSGAGREITISRILGGKGAEALRSVFTSCGIRVLDERGRDGTMGHGIYMVDSIRITVGRKQR
jgi:hypothetical protein